MALAHIHMAGEFDSFFHNLLLALDDQKVVALECHRARPVLKLTMLA